MDHAARQIRRSLSNQSASLLILNWKEEEGSLHPSTYAVRPRWDPFGYYAAPSWTFFLLLLFSPDDQDELIHTAKREINVGRFLHAQEEEEILNCFRFDERRRRRQC